MATLYVIKYSENPDGSRTFYSLDQVEISLSTDTKLYEMQEERIGDKVVRVEYRIEEAETFDIKTCELLPKEVIC